LFEFIGFEFWFKIRVLLNATWNNPKTSSGAQFFIRCHCKRFLHSLNKLTGHYCGPIASIVTWAPVLNKVKLEWALILTGLRPVTNFVSSCSEIGPHPDRNDRGTILVFGCAAWRWREEPCWETSEIQPHDDATFHFRRQSWNKMNCGSTMTETNCAWVYVGVKLSKAKILCRSQI